MPVVKRSVSFDADVAQRIEAAAAEDGLPFSTWLTAAAEKQLLLRDGLRGVAEWEAEAGALTTEERAAGEALLDRLLAQSRTETAKSAERVERANPTRAARRARPAEATTRAKAAKTVKPRKPTDATVTGKPGGTTTRSAAAEPARAV